MKSFVKEFLIGATAIALSLSPVFAWNDRATGIPVAAMGTNLSGIAYFSTEQPFINILKTGGGWQTKTSNNADTGEENYLYSSMVDSNHYPTTFSARGTATVGTGSSSSTSLTIASVRAKLWVGGTLSGTGIIGSPRITACPAGGCGVTGTYTMSSAQTISTGTTITESPTFTKLRFGALWNGPIKTGNYVFTCAGKGTFRLSGVVSRTIICPSRNIVDVTNSGGELLVDETSTQSGSGYMKDMSLVYSPDSTSSHAGVNETAFNNGETLNPLFVAAVKPMNRSFRFVDWTSTNSNQVQNWSDRAQTGWAFWGEQTSNGAVKDIGVPIEIEANVCNEAGAQYCWFPIPCAAADNYFIGHADLTLRLLKPSVRVVPETCNEAWLQHFPTALKAILNTYGSAIFTGATNQYSYIFQFSNMRAVQLARAYKREWGSSASRVYPVQGGDLGYNARNSQLLSDTPFWDGAPFGNFTGAISGCPLACVLTASGITGTSTLQVFSRVSGSGLVTDNCWVVALGTGTGGNGTYRLGGAGCTNEASESMSGQMWGSAPGATGNVSIRNSTMTVNRTASGVFAAGQIPWIVGKTQASNLPPTLKITGCKGATCTLNQSVGSSFPSTYNIVTAAPADIDAANVAALATAPYFGPTRLPLALTGDGDGGVTRALQQIKSGGIVPPCLGKNCSMTAPKTGGSTNAYTLVTGNGYTPSIANGTCTGVTFASNNTNSATIAVDSVGTLPLYDYLGNAISASNLISGGTYAGGLKNVICYTTTTGAGPVTPGWYLNWGGFAYSTLTTGDIDGAIADWTLDYEEAQAHGVSLFGYESGAQYYDVSNNSYLRSLIYNMNRAAGMGTAYTTYLTGLKAVVAGTPINQYNDVSPYEAGFAWGALEYVQEGSAPKYNAIANFSTQ